MAALISLVIKTLGDALVQEYILLDGVREQFERLQPELNSIQGFLKTADSMNFKNPDMDAWVVDVQEIAYDLDDILSNFFFQVVKEKKRRSSLRSIASFPGELVRDHEMGNQIEAIFRRIEEVSTRRKRYSVQMEQGASSSATTNEVRFRRTNPFLNNSDIVEIVGLEKPAELMKEELMKEDDRRSVVSIYGMGGIGKTTLAKLVFNRDDVKSHFELCAWTSISQQCRPSHFVWRDILRQVWKKESPFTMEEIQRMEERELVETLFHALSEHRYFVVLDDIWNVDDWCVLQSAFPDGKKGSKLMLTTRNKNVADRAEGFQWEPSKLDEKQAWELMCWKAFHMEAGKINFSSGIMECGKEMVKRCDGLPLAIVVLGGLLTKKTSLIEWESVSDRIDLHMHEDEKTGVYAILRLSIIDLPLHLKPLFFYMGLFPEDYKIEVSSLIKMWIAEGLVGEPHSDRVTMESLGRHYLDELIRRCVVQIYERGSKERSVKSCQIHDMMLEVCIKKAEEQNFFQVIRGAYDDMMLEDGMSSNKLRRCAIYLENERCVFPPQATPCLRSVIFFQISKCEPSNFPIVYKDFKLVRVLELRGVSQPELREIVKLINLRYLGLVRTGLMSLPKSIGNLVNLQTLDVRDNRHLKIPDVIWKLEELRHFQWDTVPCILNVPLRMDTLRKLHTLSYMRAESWTSNMCESVNLEKLGIVELTTGGVLGIMKSIVGGFDKLRSLSLRMRPGCLFPNLQRLSEKSQLLKLTLIGGMNSLLTHWPPRIVKLELYDTGLQDDPMPILEKLEHLARLYLFDVYDGEKIVCREEGFPTLRTLHIDTFEEIKEWVVEKGAMPRLTHCTLAACPKLKMIPEGFKFITTLKELKIIEMPTEFIQRVEEGGEDWESVKHIPSIIILK